MLKPLKECALNVVHQLPVRKRITVHRVALISTYFEHDYSNVVHCACVRSVVFLSDRRKYKYSLNLHISTFIVDVLRIHQGCLL